MQNYELGKAHRSIRHIMKGRCFPVKYFFDDGPCWSCNSRAFSEVGSPSDRLHHGQWDTVPSKFPAVSFKFPKTYA